jgi:Co/Zn/Cd efflux system component
LELLSSQRGAYSLVRDTSAVLLDMTPDHKMVEKMRGAIEGDGDHLTDLHVWRLGPSHLGAILSVETREPGAQAGVLSITA